MSEWKIIRNWLSEGVMKLWMNGWMNEWMNVWMNECMNEWMNSLLIGCKDVVKT